MALLPVVYRRVRRRLKQPFAIASGTVDTIDTVIVELGIGGGIAECRPYKRYNENVESVMGQLGSVAKQLRDDITPDEIRHLLPAGAARNALDLALLDFRAKQAGVPLWQYLELPEPRPVRTTDTTIGIATPDAMAASAVHHQNARLKVKLGGPEKDAQLEAARIRAVRAAAPHAELIVDVNEGWTPHMLRELAPVLSHLNLLLLEQPLPVAEDDALLELKLPFPVYADESVHDRGSLLKLAGKYQGVNIKLDKAGGLTEAMALKQAARTAGLGIMIGCMVASSLAVAPALLLAPDADIVDLDGPSLLLDDSAPPLVYEGGFVRI